MPPRRHHPVRHILVLGVSLAVGLVGSSLAAEVALSNIAVRPEQVTARPSGGRTEAQLGRTSSSILVRRLAKVLTRSKCWGRRPPESPSSTPAIPLWAPSSATCGGRTAHPAEPIHCSTLLRLAASICACRSRMPLPDQGSSFATLRRGSSSGLRTGRLAVQALSEDFRRRTQAINRRSAEEISWLPTSVSPSLGRAIGSIAPTALRSGLRPPSPSRIIR
jgi:hypothetical protein